MRHERRNTSGQAYALTVLAPIEPGHEPALREQLAAFGQRGESPLAQVPGTHFARWVVIDHLVFEGDGQSRDRLGAPRLLFTSNLDGDRDGYLETLRTRMPADADAIWGHCSGYPGTGDAAAFAGWFRAHQLESAMFFAAYGEQTVSEVRANVETRRALMAFALASQGLPPAELRTAFVEAFPA